MVDSSFDWLGTGTGIRYFLLFPNNLYININRDLLKVVTGSGIEVPLNHSGFTTLMKISFRIHILYLGNRGFLSVTYGSAPFSWIREAEFGTGCISRYRYRYSFESSWVCELSRRHVSWLLTIALDTMFSLYAHHMFEAVNTSWWTLQKQVLPVVRLVELSAKPFLIFGPVLLIGTVLRFLFFVVISFLCKICTFMRTRSVRLILG